MFFILSIISLNLNAAPRSPSYSAMFAMAMYSIRPIIMAIMKYIIYAVARPYILNPVNVLAVSAEY